MFCFLVWILITRIFFKTSCILSTYIFPVCTCCTRPHLRSATVRKILSINTKHLPECGTSTALTHWRNSNLSSTLLNWMAAFYCSRPQNPPSTFVPIRNEKVCAYKGCIKMINVAWFGIWQKYLLWLLIGILYSEENKLSSCCRTDGVGWWTTYYYQGIPLFLSVGPPPTRFS